MWLCNGVKLFSRVKMATKPKNLKPQTTIRNIFEYSKNFLKNLKP